MTIAEKLVKVAENEPKVYEAGRSKGYSEGYIDGISGTSFETDSSIAYRKIAPSAAQKKAQVLQLGGMTYKSVNLAAYSTFTQASNGFSVNPQEDGTVKITGSATETLNMSLHLALRTGTHFSDVTPIDMLPNVKYSIRVTKDGQPISAIGNRFEYTDEQGGTVYGWSNQDITRPRRCSSVYIQDTYEAGSTAPCGVYSVMVIEGEDEETLDNYQQYFEGLRNTKVTSLVSEGANLIPRASHNTQTINGVTFTVQEDNSIVVNGTATATTAFSLQYSSLGEHFTLNLGETYTLSGCPKGGSLETYRLIVQDIGYSQNFTDTGSGYTGVASKTQYYAFIRINAGYTANNLVFKPMLNRGSIALPYSPFGTIVDTLAVLEAVQAIEGYGLGVNSEYYNYIDFVRKMFGQRAKAVDMGTLNYSYRFSNNRHIFRVNIGDIQGQISADIPINALAADYKAVPCNATWVDRDMAYGSNSVGYQVIEFVDNRYTTAEEFKAAVSGKILVYALAEPIETDISAYITEDNLIEVEGGGTITAVNEHGLSTPSKIQFVSKVGG
jgi:hypothetical protein